MIPDHVLKKTSYRYDLDDTRIARPKNTAKALWKILGPTLIRAPFAMKARLAVYVLYCFTTGGSSFGYVYAICSEYSIAKPIATMRLTTIIALNVNPHI